MIRFFKESSTGIRAGLGSGKVAVEHAAGSIFRSHGSWVLPSLMALLFAFAQVYYHLSTMGGVGLGVIAGRVILFDYLVFVMGWLGGWAVAWRWRRNPDFIEELILTPLRPAAIAQVLMAGHIRIWRYFVFVLFAVDCVMFVIGYSLVVSGTPWFWLRVAGGTLVAVPAFALLAWFHLLTIRLAYWMFAAAAIPRMRLVATAFINFFAIPAYVLACTLSGMVVSGTLGLLGAGLYEVVSLPWKSPDGIIESSVAWLAFAIPGLLLVGLLKLLIIAAYERSFTHALLLCTWWGAGERTQPSVYPIEFRHRAYQWLFFLRREEVAAAADPGEVEP